MSPCVRSCCSNFHVLIKGCHLFCGHSATYLLLLQPHLTFCQSESNHFSLQLSIELFSSLTYFLQRLSCSLACKLTHKLIQMNFSSISPSTTVPQKTYPATGLSPSLNELRVVSCEHSAIPSFPPERWATGFVLAIPNFNHLRNLKFSSAFISEKYSFIICHF